MANWLATPTIQCGLFLFLTDRPRTVLRCCSTSATLIDFAMQEVTKLIGEIQTNVMARVV
jgi:hypothetical protein